MAENGFVPEFIDCPAQRFVGMNRSYTKDTRGEIPAQWQALNQSGAEIPNARPSGAYGICHRFDGKGQFDYLCGFEVEGSGPVPDGFESIEIPARRVARFENKTGLQNIHGIWDHIVSVWTPANREIYVPGPEIEHYPPEFNPGTGTGSVFILIEIRAEAPVA